MSEVWDQAHIEQYIADRIEESLTLDYKAAGSLTKTSEKKQEITKDVSAMANSAGGIIIYGIREDATNRHLPGVIEPIDRTHISKEWLEQIISNIRPKIDGVVIYPVPIDNTTNLVVYVVDIPQSHTAHQATDKKYYKRSNSVSTAMEDYEIRDVMGRGQYPKIELRFEIETTYAVKPLEHMLIVEAVNTGRIYAQYVNAFVDIPIKLFPPEDIDFMIPYTHNENGTEYYRARLENTGKFGYAPILPGCSHKFSGIKIEPTQDKSLNIHWEVYAENAPPGIGHISAADIEISYLP